MRIPRLPARPWVAVAAIVAAAVILVRNGRGPDSRHRSNQPADRREHAGGTAVGTPLNASADGGTVSYALSGPEAANFTINPDTARSASPKTSAPTSRPSPSTP